MKRYIYFLVILLSLISILWGAQLSKAKYAQKDEIKLTINSALFYFEHTGSDLQIPYHNNTANIDFEVRNYIEKNYTKEDIEYAISILNTNYAFSINGTNSISNEVNLTISGGDRNSETINMVFSRIDTENVPVYEEIEVLVKTTHPYTYESKFTIGINNGAIEIIGNPTNWTNQDVTLEILPATEGTTLTEYSFDGGTTWGTEPTKTYIENTEGIQIYAKDTIGSTLGPIEVNITKIDKTAPTFEIAKDIEYNADGTTKEVETLIVTLGESTSVLKNINAHDTQSGISEDGIKCYVLDTEITTTEAAENVGRYRLIYKVQDTVGNEAIREREVLVRWPLGGKYIVARQDVIGTGLSSETIGAGLYADNTDTGKDATLPFASKYYYSGKTVNNYVSFPNTSGDGTNATAWRILNVAENDTVKIITDSVLADQYTLSDSAWVYRWKWHKTALYSQLKTWANNNTIGDNEYKVDFTETGHITEAIFYTGAVDRRYNDGGSTLLQEVIDERSNTSALKDSYTEEEALNYINWSSKMGIITITDVTKSANSSTVYSIKSMQDNKTNFKNTSWMYTGKTEWSMSACATQGENFWRLDETEFLSKLTADLSIYEGYIRPTVYLKNDTIISGTGTSEDPFVVQEDFRWFDSYQTVQ